MISKKLLSFFFISAAAIGLSGMDGKDPKEGQPSSQPSQEDIRVIVNEVAKQMTQNQASNMAFVGGDGKFHFDKFRNDIMTEVYNLISLYAQKKNNDGKVALDKNGMPEYESYALPVKMLGATAATLVGGVMSAVESKAKDESKNFFTWIIRSMKEKYWRAWNRMWHGRIARELTIADINRWKDSLNNMYTGLMRVAERAQTGGKIGHGVKHLFAAADLGFGESDNAQQESTTEDKAWQENKKLYLDRIQQIITQIQFRKQYNKSEQEIVLCMDQLVAALVGDFYDGGMYARINEAKSLADLAEPHNSQALQLFKEHIDGLLGELREWVNMLKGDKSNSSSGSSGGYRSSYGGYSVSGSSWANS